MNRSQIYEYGDWEQGRAVLFLEIHNSNLLCSALPFYSVIITNYKFLFTLIRFKKLSLSKLFFVQ